MAGNFYWLAALIYISYVAIPARAAEKYALLIGIGDYAQGIPSLEGPPHDVSAVRDALTRSWGFRSDRIQVILNREATREAVLAALDGLAVKAGKGDFVFLYFSGHGTSAWAPNSVAFGMEGHTGAIVPADLRAGTARDVAAGLILSTRDLRPRLMKLDAVATVFAAFDACYSGESIKSMSVSHPGLVSRHVDLAPRGDLRQSYLSQFDRLSRDNGAVAVRDNPFPYRNLIYLSAAAKSERAWDIPSSTLAAGGRETVDGKPHGVFTNALLQGLSGQADLNRDGAITYRELHQFVVRSVQPEFGQYPQMLHAGSESETAGPVFGVARAPVAPAAPSKPRKLRVRLVEEIPALSALLTRMATIQLSKGAYDLLVWQRGETIELLHSSGTPIRSYRVAEIADLAKRIERQAMVLELMQWRNPERPFGVELEIQPGDREMYFNGEKIEMRVRPERDAFLLLLNIDVEGTITVQYPLAARQVTPSQGGEWLRASSGTVGAPLGTEMLKVLAFRDKPDELNSFAKAQFGPEDPRFDRLLKMMRGASAEATLALFTVEAPKP